MSMGPGNEHEDLGPGSAEGPVPDMKQISSCCAVPEVEWDASLKLQRRDGGYFPHSHSQRWDGSQHSEVVERLTSRRHDVLGDIGKSIPCLSAELKLKFVNS